MPTQPAAGPPPASGAQHRNSLGYSAVPQTNSSSAMPHASITNGSASHSAGPANVRPDQQQQHHPSLTHSQGPSGGGSSGSAGGPSASSLPQIIQSILQVGHSSNVQAAQMLGLGLGGPTASARANGFAAPTLAKLDKETEACWVQAGRTAEAVGNMNKALASYETALRHSPYNAEALTQTASILRQQEKFPEAIEYFTRVVALNETAGDVWGALGHCYLMMDDTSKAYACYQQAIVNLPQSKGEPKLWYGIGILYDRHNSLNMAEEAFVNVINHDPNFEKANEIYFRLGIIYKQKRNSTAALNCFRYILGNPPRPLSEPDIWFQIGQVFDQQQDFVTAKQIYETLLTTDANHAKVLRELGGIFARQDGPFFDLEKSCEALTKSLEEDSNDPFAWYLLGRSYMAGAQYGKAYEAYQQAVYRDGRNPAFWCSIGVLYYKISQYHDSLDAYSRAIRTNPYLAEVWHNLGALYESCNDQLTDAVDAYQRALSLDDSNEAVRRRLSQIDYHRHGRGQPLSPPPKPIDISPLSESWNAANGSASFMGPPSANGASASSPAPFGPPFSESSTTDGPTSMPVNNLTSSNGGRRSIGGRAPSIGGVSDGPHPSYPGHPNGASTSARAPPPREYTASYSLSQHAARPNSQSGPAPSRFPGRGSISMDLDPAQARSTGPWLPSAAVPISAQSPMAQVVPPVKHSLLAAAASSSPPPLSPAHQRESYLVHRPPVSDEGERGRPAMGYRDHQTPSVYSGPAYMDRWSINSPSSMGPGPKSVHSPKHEGGPHPYERERYPHPEPRHSVSSRGVSPTTPYPSAQPALAGIRPIPQQRERQLSGSHPSQGKPQNVILPRTSQPHPKPISEAASSAPQAQEPPPAAAAPPMRGVDDDYDQEGEGADSLIALASGGSGGSIKPAGVTPKPSEVPAAPPAHTPVSEPSDPIPSRSSPVTNATRKRSLEDANPQDSRRSSGSPSDSEAQAMSKRLKIGGEPWQTSGSTSNVSSAPSRASPAPRNGSPAHSNGSERPSPVQQTPDETSTQAKAVTPSTEPQHQQASPRGPSPVSNPSPQASAAPVTATAAGGVDDTPAKSPTSAAATTAS